MSARCAATRATSTARHRSCHHRRCRRLHILSHSLSWVGAYAHPHPVWR
jgi:hypothetical protein